MLAVDSSGKIRSSPKIGDELFLMCGVACKTSSGSWDPQYRWKDNSGSVIAKTREHIVTLSSSGTVSYTCEILNSECASKLSSAQKIVSVLVRGKVLVLGIYCVISKPSHSANFSFCAIMHVAWH